MSGKEDRASQAERMTCTDTNRGVRKTVQGKVRGQSCVAGSGPLRRLLSREAEEVGYGKTIQNT